MNLTGARFRFDAIMSAFREPADRLEALPSAALSTTYGPRGLWQCRVAVSTDRGDIDVPMALLAVEAAGAQRAAFRGTFLDFALTLSPQANPAGEDELRWELTWNDSTDDERLASLEMLEAYSGCGTLMITSVEPRFGNGSYQLTGFELDADTQLELALHRGRRRVLDRTGVDIAIGRHPEPGLQLQLLTAGDALQKGSVELDLPAEFALHGISAGDQELVDAIIDYRFKCAAVIPLGDKLVDLGEVSEVVAGRVIAIDESAKPSSVTLRRTDSAPVPATITDR